MGFKLTGIGLVVILVLLTQSGCVFTPDLDRVQHMVAREIEPATMKTEVKLNLGPTALSLAKLVTRWANVDEEARAYLSHIKHVEINVQKISGLSSLDLIRWPGNLESKLEQEGWEILVKAREDDEIVLVLYKPQRETIRSMYVISLSLDELVLVKVGGRLDTLMIRALEDHGFAAEVAANVH